MDDTSTTLKQLQDTVMAFLAERGWGRDTDPRGLATSIALEAAELLEHYQWGDQANDPDGLAPELADIIIYCLEYAHATKTDVAAAVEAKLARNAIKYPVSQFNPENQDKDAYYAVKKQYREQRNQ